MRALVAVLCGAILTGQTQGPPKRLRSGVTLVPVNVRVLDRDGHPVTDLTKEDFQILEDGVPQPIVEFQRIAHGERGAGESAPTATDPAAAAGGRVFLIVIGRGRMVGPGKDLDALISFSRSRLGSDDRVAVMAYNRATPFIQNPDALARFFDVYKRKHEEIESLLEQWFSGLRARYGNAEIPPFIQKKIDALFEGVSGVRRAEAAHRGLTDDTAHNPTHAVSDSLQRAALLADRVGGLPDLDAERTLDRIGLSFDAFVELSSRTLWDLANVHKGIEYLHYASGEKHLFFVTRHGLFLPGMERDDSLARAASNARVTLDILYTDGPAVEPPTTGRRPSSGAGFQQMFAVSDMRAYAESTGGQFTAFRAGRHALDRLDTATRAYYLLAYEPADPNPTGTFRKLSVRVKRSGAKVLHRAGYFARPPSAGFDARSILTYTRIASAGGRALPMLDIRVTARATKRKETEAAGVHLTANIDISNLTLDPAGHHRSATLDIAVFCGDQREAVVCESWQKMPLTLSAEQYAKARSSGIPYAITVPASGDVKYVKIIVFHYESDATGSLTVALR